MALAGIGLQTQIWNNNAKSLALLLSYPLLFLCLVWVSLFVYERIEDRFINVEPSKASSQNNQLEEKPFKQRNLSQTAQAATADTLKTAPTIFSLIGIWFVIAYFFHQRIINSASGAHSVSRKDYYRLYNLLENLCISCGMAMPKLYVIDSKKLNAYASGISAQSYAVTITQGMLDTLNDEELEAVLAHELAHIRNGDARLMIIAVVFVGMLSFLLSAISFNRKEDETEYTLQDAEKWAYSASSLRNPATLYEEDKRGLLLTVNSFELVLTTFRTYPFLGAIYFFAYVILLIGHGLAIGIRMAISRQREYIADADAVKLTRNPSALISALRKIDAKAYTLRVDMLNAMCIANAPGTWDWFASHPPIEKRIAALIQFGGRIAEPRNTPHIQSVSPPVFGRKQPPTR